MIVVVAEKPSVGRDIARVLKCTEKGEGFLKGEQYLVTWAIGHLVSLCEPGEANPAWLKWSMGYLPMLPDSIPLKVLPNTVSTVNGETADTFVYDWLDSAGFNFDGCQPGLYLIFR